ncbi:hypothetical protein B9Z55_002245 [Caenorhabditis nigoni]|uniref:Uncharacterized protein n=1 Tax=Caenorhabditis nigoni TaxID=1611254 RepID=A0A2G5VJJ7_9PELO|nr:hypothetical protein B9Z55_002245 [Caenorhabditis nigoni]
MCLIMVEFCVYVWDGVVDVSVHGACETSVSRPSDSASQNSLAPFLFVRPSIQMTGRGGREARHDDDDGWKKEEQERNDGEKKKKKNGGDGENDRRSRRGPFFCTHTRAESQITKDPQEDCD